MTSRPLGSTLLPVVGVLVAACGWSPASRAGAWDAPPAFSTPVLAASAAPPEAPLSLTLAAGGFALAPEVPLTLAAGGSVVAPPDERRPERKPRRPRPVGGPAVLNPLRAQVLLRSLTVPGWGQASVGRRTSAVVFALAEAGVWGTYTAFRVQERMRRDAYERTARVTAGIDLRKRDEEYRRIVGSFLSSDEYNLLVVYRDAANLYYDDPVQFQRYIDENQLGGSDAWSWPDVESLLRYRGQRKDAQRAALRANASLAAAIINRLLSAVHSARASAQPASPNAWRLEVEPTDDGDAAALRVGVRRRF